MFPYPHMRYRSEDRAAPGYTRIRDFMDQERGPQQARRKRDMDKDEPLWSKIACRVLMNVVTHPFDYVKVLIQVREAFGLLSLVSHFFTPSRGYVMPLWGKGKIGEICINGFVFFVDRLWAHWAPADDDPTRQACPGTAQHLPVRWGRERHF